MMDLMYFGYGYGENDHATEYQSDFIKEVKEKFPNVRLENAYDEIKGYRQSVYLEDTEKDDFFSFLFGKGWFEMSLTAQIAMMTEEEHDDVKRWINLAKKQYPEAFKPEALTKE